MGSGSQQSTSSTQPPKEFQDALNSQLKNVQGVGNLPYMQYMGPQAAPFTQAQNAAFNSINNAQTAWQPYFNKATTALSGSNIPLIQFGAKTAQEFMDPYRQQVLSQIPQFSGSEVQKYMDPYTQNVINATRANLNENNAMQREELKSKAIGAGAFGGDRLGVTQAELARKQKLADDATISNLYSQGYGNALGAFERQQGLASQNLNTGYGTGLSQFNQENQNRLNQNRQGLDVAQMYAGLGNQALQNQLTGANAQLSAGNQQQALAEKFMNIPYQNFQAQMGYPYQQNQYLTDLISRLSSAAGGTSTSTTPGANPISQLAGLGLTGASMYQMLSDRRLKTDIDKVGSIDGINIYDFKYKGDQAPHRGVMAQEVEGKFPDAVSMKNGYRVVDYSKLPDGLPHYASGGSVKSSDNPLSVENVSSLLDLFTKYMNQDDMGNQFMGGLPQQPQFADGGYVDDSDYYRDGEGTNPTLSYDYLYYGIPDGIGESEPDQMDPSELEGAYGLDSLGGGAANDRMIGLPSVPLPSGGRGNQFDMRVGNAQLPPVPLPRTMATSVYNEPVGPTQENQTWLDKLEAKGVDPYMAMMHAGLSMAAGTSPNALTNIAQGGLAGLQSIKDQDKAEVERRYKETMAKIATDRLGGQSTAALKELEFIKNNPELAPQLMNLKRGAKTINTGDKTIILDASGKPVQEIKNELKPGDRPEARREQARSKAIGEDEGKMAAKLPQLELDVAEAIKSANALTEHPGFKPAVGSKMLSSSYAFGYKDKPFEGTDAADWEAMFGKVQGELFKRAYDSLRGGGSITEAESAGAKQALTEMSQSQSEGDFIKARDRYAGYLQQGLDKMKQQYGQYSPISAAPTASTTGGDDRKARALEILKAKGRI